MGRRSNLSPILNVGNIITEALDKAKKGAATTNINKQTNAIIPPSIKEVDSLNAQKIIDSPELAGKWKADNQLNQKQKQIPILEEKADNLLEGKITGKEFRTEVKNVNPIEEINEIPVIPTFTDIAGSLKSNQIEKGILGLNKQIKDGTRVSSRLDIPAYEKYNKWIVSVHDAFDKKGNTDVLNGESIAYSKTIVLKDVSFKALPASASKIAAGRTDKGTIARIFGNIKNEAPESVAARAKGYLNNEEWTEIGFNPYKHGFFYNKKTGAPVSSADEVVQIGPLVLAHNVKKMTISQMKKLGPKGGLQIRAGKPIEGLKNLKETKTVFNKGGTAMKQQMEMFEDGGLRDQGDTIDPVSGNDVPSGSTQEEVRDDIPAQLSEGEFVLPADVVRFHGLEKIMALRDEAKAGLAKMEAMGQMGNSEEATMPDDMPFGMEDLDMEDEEAPKEMAEGGMVMIAGKPMKMPIIAGKQLEMAEGGNVTNTGTYQIPTNIASQPSYFQNYAQSTAPFQPFVPPAQQTSPVVNAATNTNTGPSFNTLMPTVGGKRETLEYRNDAGQKMFIPFIDGKPIYPIPEGYTKYIAEEVTTPDKPTNVQSTSVRQDTEDGGDSNVFSGTNTVRGLDNAIVSTDFTNQTSDKVAQNMGNMSSTDRASAVQNAMQTSYGYTGLAKGMQQLGAVMTPGVMASKMYGQKTMNPMDVLSQIGQPDMGARDAITNAFGYDEKGYDMDDPMDASLAGVDQQNAINTAMFGGSMVGTEGKTRGGIQGITVADIQKEYGIAPSYTSRGRNDVQIEIGTNPGQMMNGVFYDVNGIGNGEDSGYSSLSDMMGYLSVSIGKHGYYGTLSLAKEQAKKGNKKAIAVLKDMATKGKEKGATRGGTGSLGVETNQFGGKSLGSGYGIGKGTGKPGSQTIGPETDVTGISTDKGLSPSTSTNPNETNTDNTSSTGAVGSTGGLGGGTGAGYGGGSEGTDTSNESNSGMDSVGMTYKGSLITKRKASGKLKPQYKKRGGLASR